LSRPKTSKSIAADIERTFRANLRLLQESMKGLDLKSRAYLDRVTAKAKLEQQYRDERSRRNLDPLNLGAATRVRYEFSATIDEQPGEVNAERQAFNDSLDAEFPSEPSLLPEPQPKNTKKKRTK
jgi:hypothetical protein